MSLALRSGYLSTQVSEAGLLLALAFPWLMPFTFGPTAAVAPWLASAFCACIVLLLSGHLRIQLMASAWTCAALLSALVGGLQYFGATQFFEPWINRADYGVAFANLRQRNQFATLMNIGLVALWWLIRVHDGSGKRSQLLWLLCAAALGVGNAISSSRTGLVQLVALTMYLWVFQRNNDQWTRRLLASAVTAYVGGALLMPVLAGIDPAAHGIFARFGDDAPACASRMVLWRNVLQLVELRPWLGWGWGELDFAHYITLYQGPRFCDILDNAHSLPLHLAVELGIPCALVVSAVAGWLILKARPWHREVDPSRPMACLILALIGIHSLLEYPLWYGPFQLTTVLCCVLLWRGGAGRIRPPSARLTLALIQGSALAIIGALSYTAWDYHRISQIYLPAGQRALQYRDNTLEKIRESRLFEAQVQFAELTTTRLTAQNAERLHAMAASSLHFSPEPRVIEKLIESAVMLGRDDEARFHLARFKAAFPEAHAKRAATFMPPR